MTGLLTDVMHDRADQLDAPDLDLAEITRDGGRRVRTRRAAVAGGLAAAAAVAALAVPALFLAGDGDDPVRRDLAADGTAAEPQPLSWITGSTLHRAGQPDADLGVNVRAWVWVGDDIAFTDAARRVHLWTGDPVQVIGSTAEVASDVPELVSDGTFVAWVAADGRVERYDATDGTLVRAPMLSGREPRVTAIDGSQVYAADTAGVYAWRPTAPDSYETLSEDEHQVVLDAEGGTTIQLAGDRQATVTGPGRDVTLTVDGFANLSPSGGQVMVESDDEGLLLDTATGQRLPLRSEHAWSLPFQWLDDTRVVVLAFDGIRRANGSPRAYLQECETISGACDVPGTEVPAGSGAVQLPIGIHLSE